MTYNVDIVFRPGDIGEGEDNVFATTIDEALEHSIEKWQALLAWAKDNRGEELGVPGWDTCNLCRLAISENCQHCPVMKRTGWSRCEETPYMDVLRAMDVDPCINPTLIDAIEAEVNFLISLRPEPKP